MAKIFAGTEVVEMGIQIEKNGMDFYNELITKTKSEKAKDIFKFLSAEEARHIVVFNQILDSVKKYEPQEAYPGEYFSYMNKIAGDYVFTQKDKGKEMAKKTNSDTEAVDMGIGFEKDSIIFYEAMKKVVPDHDHSLLEELISQEKQHLKKLENLKGSL